MKIPRLLGQTAIISYLNLQLQSLKIPQQQGLSLKLVLQHLPDILLHFLVCLGLHHLADVQVLLEDLVAVQLDLLHQPSVPGHVVLPLLAQLQLHLVLILHLLIII